MFFQGGGFSSTSAWTEEEYQAYVQKMQEEREARIKRMYEAQELVDSIDDPEKKLEAQRQRYKCGEDYLTVDEIPQWSDLSTDLFAKQKQKEAESNSQANTTASSSENNNNNNNNERASFMSFFSRRPALTFDPVDKMTRYPVDDSINSKIALIRGDITTLEVDGIVNAANSSLMGGGGVDGAIHSAAGPLLENECRQLNGAETGETKITKGYALPAKNILHTVGPIERGDRQLRACYRSSLDLCIKHNLKTVAFCCISTGIYGFPLKRATHIALDEARKFLNSLKNGTYESGPLAENNVGPRSRRGNKDKDKDDKEEEPKTIDDNDDDDNNKEEENVNQNNQKQQQQQPGLNAIDKIIFCVFTAEELQSYENLLPTYFPIEGFYAEKYDPSEIDPAKLDDFNRDDARVWNSGGGGGVMMMGDNNAGGGGGSASDETNNKGQNGISFV